MVEVNSTTAVLATVLVVVLSIVFGSFFFGASKEVKESKREDKKEKAAPPVKASSPAAAAVVPAAAPAPAPSSSSSSASGTAASSDEVKVEKKEDARKAKDAAKKQAKKDRKEAEKKRTAKQVAAKQPTIAMSGPANDDDANEDSDSDDEEVITQKQKQVNAAGSAPSSSQNQQQAKKSSDTAAAFATTIDNSDDGWNVVEKNPLKKVKKAKKASLAVKEETKLETVTSVTADNSAAEATAANAAVEAVVEAPAPAPAPEIIKTVAVDPSRFGIIIGSKGVNKIGIQDATNTEIRLPRNGEYDADASEVEVQVIGSEEREVNAAIRAVKDLVSKGYSQLLEGENFTEGSITVHPSFLPEIIGKAGSTLKAIQSHFSVRLNTPTVARGSNDTTCKIFVVGDRDKVKKAKELLKELMRYHHTAITHPGVSHLEMIVDPTLHKFVIGAKGSEIKHIQQNFKVHVYIPNDNSFTTDLLVVGAAEDAQRAEAYILKVLEKAQAPKEEKPSEFELKEAKRAEEDAADLEPWMQTYVRESDLEQQHSLVVDSGSIFSVTDAAFPTL